jgi:hypothetical protein
MQPYLLEVKEKHFVFNGVKSWPLVWLVSIPTVGSKCASGTAKFNSPRLPKLATSSQSPEQFSC